MKNNPGCNRPKPGRQRMLLVGCGGMGRSHAMGFIASGRVELRWVVDRDAEKAKRLRDEFSAAHWATDIATALQAGDCDFAVIATLPSQHAALSIAALESGLHVYCEKPVAARLEESQAMMAAAVRTGRKLFIGHQLRYTEPWRSIVAEIRAGLLGFPIVMRMTGNQQTFDETWQAQQRLIRDTSPIVDCGTHYVNLMLAMNPAPPTLVGAMGTSIAHDVDWPAHYNYGLLQVRFANQSVGHYEAGWGPMMTKNAWYIKDFSGPKGSLSVLMELDHDTPDNPPTMITYTLHYRALKDNSYRTLKERSKTITEKTGKAESLRGAHTCFLEAVEEDRDIRPQFEEAHQSLAVVLAADRSVREGRMVCL